MSYKSNKYMIVFDFETDGLDAAKGIDNITQIGAIAVDLKTLSIEKNSKLNIVVCPSEIKKLPFNDYYKKHRGALDKHAEWRNEKPEDYVNFLKDKGIPEKDAWEQFIKYCSKYKKKVLPSPGGQNIINFDLPIVEHLCKKHKKTYPFGRIDDFDLRKIVPLWFLYSKNPPKSYSMGNLRPWFQMSEENAHDALQDVIDTAELLIRFLELHKKLIERVPTLNYGMDNSKK